MNRLSQAKTLAASLTLTFAMAACTTVPMAPVDDAPTPEPETKTAPAPDHKAMMTGRILQGSCNYYSGVLTMADQAHFSGPTTVSHEEIAKGALRGMLAISYVETARDPVTGELDETRVTFADPDKKKDIQSLTIGDKTWTVTEPEAGMQSYTDHCNYLNKAVVELSEATNTHMSRMYEYGLSGAIKASRDPHSAYLWLERYEELQTSTKGEYGGIGIEMIPKKDWVDVVKVNEDGPAGKAGLKKGDRIEKLDGTPIRQFKTDDIVKHIKGDPGTDVVLTIRRGDEEPFDVPVTREIVRTQAVTAKLIGPQKDTAYFKVNIFSSQTTAQLMDAQKQLYDQSLHINTKPYDKIILDFRNDPGGLLPQAVTVSDNFIDAKDGEKKPLVAIGRNAKGEQGRVFYADEAVPGKMDFKQITVLQNHGSASASEIVAGALQDDGVPIVGSNSFGKGSVQTIIPLEAQARLQDPETGEITVKNITIGALKLTTHAFFPGESGLSNQGSGVIPDIKVIYNDVRDEIDSDAMRESKLKHTLMSKEQTRESMIPQFSCELKEEFAGALSAEEIAAIDEDLIVSATIEDEKTGKKEDVQMLDADLDCAMNFMEGGSDYTIITPYKAPAPKPTS